MASTQQDELRIAEIPTGVTVDPVTLDIIEGALKNARFEMDAVLFIASDRARFITGQLLCVDGGYSAGKLAVNGPHVEAHYGQTDV